MSSELAVFDVDGTLTVRDCVVPFMSRISGTRVLVEEVVRNPLALTREFARRDRNGIKERFVRSVFRDRKVSDVDKEGVLFAAHVHENWMRPDVARRLRWHQHSGHVVVLVSASLGPYLHPLGDLLGVDGVVCTELERAGGVYTGTLRGANCRGAEKVARLRQWCAGAGFGDLSPTFAYGDSSGDTEMLATAAHPHNVRRATLTDWDAG